MPSTIAESALLPRYVLGLLLPADASRPAGVITVPASAVGLSDAIGGGLLDEIWQGVLSGRAYRVYADEERVTKRLPQNARAVALAATLSWRNGTRAVDGLSLLGDLLVVGAETPGRDSDVPRCVLQAADEAGLFS